MKPPHILLRQYRVLQIALTGYLSYLAWVLVKWLTATPFSELSDWHVAPVTATVPALVLGLLKIVESVAKRNESDE